MKSEQEIKELLISLREDEKNFSRKYGEENSTKEFRITAHSLIVGELLALEWMLEDEKVDKKLGKTLKCSRCKNIWTYKGANEYCANCSKCKSTVFIKNNQI